MALKSATVPAKKVTAKKVEPRTVLAVGEYEGHAMTYVGPEIITDGEPTGALDPRSKFANLQGPTRKFMALLHMDLEGDSVLRSLVEHLLERVPEERLVEALDGLDSLVLWYVRIRCGFNSATLAETREGEDIGEKVMEACIAGA